MRETKRRGPGRTVGADLVADGFFADFPPLWVAPGAAASFKGGCVFAGLQICM